MVAQDINVTMSRVSHARRMASVFSALVLAFCFDSSDSAGWFVDISVYFSSAVETEAPEELPLRCFMLGEFIARIHATWEFSVFLKNQTVIIQRDACITTI